MAISHNPIFNRALATGAEQRRIELAQAEVDAEFAKIAAKADRMTVEGSAGKVLGLLFVLVAAAAATWFIQPLQALLFPALFVGLGLALWATFSRTVRPGVIIAYAAVEGVVIGGLSTFYEMRYPGIVQNAVLATFATAGAMFFAYRFGLIKVNARFTKVMTFALFGYLGFAVINLVVSMVTGSGGVYSSGWAWLAGLVGVLLAAFTLNLDFEAIVAGSKQGLPKENEWRVAFGLTASLIWLYVEILRLLSIFNRD